MKKNGYHFAKNYFIGSRELIILEWFCLGFSIFIVVDSYEDFKTVHMGSLKGCIGYCEKELVEYQQSLY